MQGNSRAATSFSGELQEDSESAENLFARTKNGRRMIRMRWIAGCAGQFDSTSVSVVYRKLHGRIGATGVASTCLFPLASPGRGNVLVSLQERHLGSTRRRLAPSVSITAGLPRLNRSRTAQLMGQVNSATRRATRATCKFHCRSPHQHGIARAEILTRVFRRTQQPKRPWSATEPAETSQRLHSGQQAAQGNPEPDSGLRLRGGPSPKKRGPACSVESLSFGQCGRG